MKKLLLLMLLFAGAGILSRCASAQTTLNLSDCSAPSLQSAWNSMSSGAYVLVFPSCAAGGTGTWTTGLRLTIPANVTSVTIEGQTTVSCTGTAGTSSYSCTAADNTVLTDSYAASNGPLIQFNLGSAAFRLTGVSFEGGTATSGDNKPNGFLTFGGTSTSFRIDHCDFNTTTYTISNFGGGFTIFGALYGVVDHSVFTLSIENNGVRDYAGSADYGDALWSQPTNFGSSSFLFVENNVFNWGASNDCDEGGRMVMRYNTILANPDPFNGVGQSNDTGLWQGHQMGQGTSTDRTRGCRALEIYHNYVSNSNPSQVPEYADGDGGSGTGLVWGNTITSGYSYDVIFQNDREIGNHSQSNTPNGPGYCGTNSNGVAASWDGNSIAATGWPCIDQTGRGQGDLYNGAAYPNAKDTVTGTMSWPRNMLEPWYVWDETIASGQVYNAPAWAGVRMTANLDFYSQVSAGANTSPTSPFNGSIGTGWGTLSNRPTTCKAGPGGTYGQSPTGSYGVAYFATDQGTNGTLYICTATNIWTAVYQPYTYPHPLVSGGGGGGGSSPLSAPGISPGSGSYTSPQTITITGPSGATVCYRTDGNPPGASTPGTCDAGSTTYSGSFSLTIPSTGVTVEAIATESGQIDSTVASATYTLATCNQTSLGGNWTCVSEASNSTGTSVNSLTAGPMSVNPPAGSLVVVFQWEGSNAPCATPVDTLGTRFAAISTATVAAASMSLCDWYGVVSTSGQESVTCGAAATATGMGCMAVDVSGQSASQVVDQTCTRSNAVSASGINNMNCSSAITVEQANELVLAAAFGDYGTRSAGTNFTMIDALNWTGEYFMEAAPTTWTPTETISASGLNYGFLAMSLHPYNLQQTPLAPTGLVVTVR
jgi:hypothetical protein